MNYNDTKQKWLTTRQKADKEQLSPKQVIRRAKKGFYPRAYQPSKGSEWRFPAAELPAKEMETLTAESIAIEDKRKQAVLKHFRELRLIAKEMKLQLWLPPPWQWDVADLRCVFYVNTQSVRQGRGITGYKLPDDLASSEESKGHFRDFNGRSVHWKIKEDESIASKLPAEENSTFGNFIEHTQGLLPWVLFTEWKHLAGEYLHLCSSLLNRIVQDTKNALGTKSELSGWTIYRDAFCVKETQYRCAECGAENVAGSKFCQDCNLPLGLLRPLIETYECSSNHPEVSSIHIPGWGNIEESVKVKRFEAIVRGHTALREKYQGCGLVETILEREKEVKKIRTQLGEAIEFLSQQHVFSGRCPKCPQL